MNKVKKLIILLLFILGISPFEIYGEQSNVVSVTMGNYVFSWTFDKPVTYGYFIDGQPWIIEPQEGINMISASPARKNAVNTFNPYTGAAVTADINITVVNPVKGTYYKNNTGSIIIANNFGWDSRGAIRYATATVNYYDSTLGWDGITPKLLHAGDIVTTPKSKIIQTSGVETCLDAVAVLTVLASMPPVDAFRPGVLRSKERKINPEIITFSQIKDLTPYLLEKPTVDIYGRLLGNTVSTVPPTEVENPTALSSGVLTSLFPGPCIMIAGLNNNRSFKATYNDSGFTYGADVCQNLGDLSIGTIAGWLTSDQRKTCQIHFIQRAIDMYEALMDSCVFTHNGAHLPGNGALLTIAGTMLNHQGMLNINNSVLGRDPAYFMSDYSQIMYIQNSSSDTGIIPAIGAMERTSVNSTVASFQNKALIVDSIGSACIKASSTSGVSAPWKMSRSATELLNLKIRIESGTGSGSQYYVVTGLKKWLPLGSAVSTSSISGGVFTLKPDWQNGTPDATSVFKTYTVVQEETPCWAFKNAGVGSTGVFAADFSVSPDADYAVVDLGAYISNLITMYAVDAESNYKSGFDKWMLDILKRPGYGAYMFSATNSRLLFKPDGYRSVRESSVLSKLWYEKVMKKVGLINFPTSALLADLNVPGGVKTLVDSPIDNLDFTFHQSNNSISFESNQTIKLIEIYSISGSKIVSNQVNDCKGTIHFSQRNSDVCVIKAVMNDKVVVRKCVL